jgi:hypothetical protein
VRPHVLWLDDGVVQVNVITREGLKDRRAAMSYCQQMRCYRGRQCVLWVADAFVQVNVMTERDDTGLKDGRAAMTCCQESCEERRDER